MIPLQTTEGKDVQNIVFYEEIVKDNTTGNTERKDIW